MPERAGPTDRLCAGAPVRIGAAAVLPVERVVLHAVFAVGCCWFSATKQPHAVIVRDAAGVRALGTDAAPVSLHALREQVPGLDEALATL